MTSCKNQKQTSIKMEESTHSERYPQSIEYVESICMDKNIIFTDSNPVPITFLVSNSLNSQDKASNESLQGTIVSESTQILNKDNQVVEENSQEKSKPLHLMNFSNDVKTENLTKSEDVLLQMENEAVPIATSLEDFMDVVTTYQCKFCRFSCPWKSGLMSHIRCCHVDDEKRLSPIKNDRQTKMVVNAKKEETLIEDNSITMAKDANENITQASNKIDDLPLIPKNEQVCIDDGEINERHIFLCGQCTEGFASLDECKQHMVNDHDLNLNPEEFKQVRKRGRPRKRPNKCNIQNTLPTKPVDEKFMDVKLTKFSKTLPNKKEVNTTQVKQKSHREELNEKAYKCPHAGCGHRFSTEAHLHYHYTSHSDSGKPFLCQECREHFDHWRGLVMHLWKEHAVDVDLHACPDCEYKTNSFFKLENHRKIHSDERAFVCQTCGKGFKQISQLRNHIVIHLDRKNLQKKRWYSQQQCETCGRTFSDAKCLRKHEQAVHRKLRPYVCSFCGHLSARKAMLQLHMRQHTGEKPFLCEHCDYRTGDHNSLRRHRMRHTGAKPYKCPHCPYACIQAISYKTHLKNKHPGMDGLFACNICSFKSVSKENFANHMLDHKQQTEPKHSHPEMVLPDTSNDPLTSTTTTQMELGDSTMEQLESILPGNITTAQLIYSCLNALSQDGNTIPTSVTINIPPSSASSDGTQTITIQLPSSQGEEGEACFLTIQQDGTTTLVLPSTDNENQESAEPKLELIDQNISADASLDCNMLIEETEGVPENCEDNSSLVIAPVESINESEKLQEIN